MLTGLLVVMDALLEDLWSRPEVIEAAGPGMLAGRDHLARVLT